MNRILLSLLLLVGGPVAAVGQTAVTAVLQGTVRDQTGGVLRAVPVSLVGDTGVPATVNADADGQYRFEGLSPGTYVATVEAAGFVPFTASVDLRAGEATVLDVTLNLSLTVSVEVTESGGLSSRRNLSSMILTGDDIAALPDDPTLFMQRLIEMAGGAARPGSVAVFVDGFREFQRMPPKETIEMIRINSNPFSAEFAGASSERIEITSTPGSEGFHGGASAQFRDSALEARNPLADTKPPMQYLYYNGYLQGPIRVGQVGFMAWAGQTRQDENAVVYATVLDPVTLVARPFGANLPVPMRSTSVLLKSDFRLFGQLVNASYSGARETTSNLGLGGGLNLLERSYDGSSSSDEGRVWWTWIGRNSLHDVRIEVSRDESTTTPRSSAPSLDVLDAFGAGGSQNAGTEVSKGLQLAESVTVQDGSHTWKVGAQLDATWHQSTDRSGFGGSFTFGSGVERDRFGAPQLDIAGRTIPISPIENYRRTLLGAPGYGPSQFSIVSGNPQLDITQWNLGWFVMDDWSVSDRLSVSYGVRHELQNNLSKRLVNINLAPRGFLSWLVDEEGKNAIDVGGGIFYTPVDADISLETRRLDGTRQRRLVVQNPSFFQTVPSTLGGVLTAQESTYVKSDDLRMPYLVSANVTYERALPRNVYAMVEYEWNRGVNLLRSRNVGSPSTGTAGAGTNPLVLQFESTGRSTEHQLSLGLNAGGLGSIVGSVYGYYTLGRRYSDTDSAYSIPADSGDLRAEYGPAGDDIRHQVIVGAGLGLPGGLFVSPYLSVMSGQPFDITTGRDNNGDAIFTDRPAFAESGETGAIQTPYGLLNPNPQSGDRIIPRNLGRARAQFTTSLAVSRSFPKGVSVTLNLDNLLSNDRLVGANGVVTSPAFGLPNQALTPRRAQISLRYGF